MTVNLIKFSTLLFTMGILGVLIFNGSSHGILFTHTLVEMEEKEGKTYGKVSFYQYEEENGQPLNHEEIIQKYAPLESVTYDITPVTRKSFEIDNFKRFFVGYIPKLYALSDTLNVSFHPVIGGRDQYEHFMRFHQTCGETPSELERYKEASKGFCDVLEMQRDAFKRYMSTNPAQPCDPHGLTWLVTRDPISEVIGLFRIERTGLYTYSSYSVFSPLLKQNQDDIRRMLTFLRAQIMETSGFRRR